MRMDLPRCDVMECKYRFDGNCTKPETYACSISAMKAENAILKTKNKLLNARIDVLSSDDFKLTVKDHRETKARNDVLESENAELRARLEKSVELPCKVGDTVYHVGITFLDGYDKFGKRIADCEYRVSPFLIKKESERLNSYARILRHYAKTANLFCEIIGNIHDNPEMLKE